MGCSYTIKSFETLVETIFKKDSFHLRTIPYNKFDQILSDYKEMKNINKEKEIQTKANITISDYDSFPETKNIELKRKSNKAYIIKEWDWENIIKSKVNPKHAVSETNAHDEFSRQDQIYEIQNDFLLLLYKQIKSRSLISNDFLPLYAFSLLDKENSTIEESIENFHSVVKNAVSCKGKSLKLSFTSFMVVFAQYIGFNILSVNQLLSEAMRRKYKDTLPDYDYEKLKKHYFNSNRMKQFYYHYSDVFEIQLNIQSDVNIYDPEIEKELTLDDMISLFRERAFFLNFEELRTCYMNYIDDIRLKEK